MADADLDMGEFDKFKDAVSRIQTTAAPLAVKTIGLALAEIQRRIAPYPPQPSRTRSRHFNTYVRGIGRFPRAAFTEQSGGGFKISRRKARGGIRYTSQQMNRRFEIEVKAVDQAVEGELRNNASYSGYVLGTKDQNVDPHQVIYHAATGWVNRDDAIEQAMPAIDRLLSELGDQIIGSLKVM